MPIGLSPQGGHVPNGGLTSVLTLTAAADAQSAPAGPWLLHLEGLSADAERIRRRAVQRIILSADADGAAPVLTLTQFAAALTAAEPFAVRGPTALELVEGYPVAVPVTVARARDQAQLAVEVTGVSSTGAPPGK